MIRGTVTMVGLIGVVCAATADDTDPVKEKLFAAKVAYDAELRDYRKLAGAWFDAREEAARKDGNKQVVDQIKDERKAFDEDGFLPKSAPAAVTQKQADAKRALEKAYDQAVKEYLRAKKDDEAAAAEAEWKSFAAKVTAVNLLALVNPKTHAVSGEWKRDGKTLLGGNAKLQFPYEPGAEYDLEVTCRRVTGNDCISVGLVAGGRPVVVIVDGWASEGHASGLDCVDKKQALDNSTTVKGALLKADQDHTLVYSVRGGKIDVLLNGKLVIAFKGDFARLSLTDGYGVPNKKALFLSIASNSSFRIDRAVVVPVKGTGKILK